jgi:hypothetical protein
VNYARIHAKRLAARKWKIVLKLVANALKAATP